jgi:hypothetical protein
MPKPVVKSESINPQLPHALNASQCQAIKKKAKRRLALTGPIL